MQLYYFHLTENGERSEDTEGSAFASFELAYLSTRRAVQDMWWEMVQRGKDPRACSFQIEDDSSHLLATIPFAEFMAEAAFSIPAIDATPCPQGSGDDFPLAGRVERVRAGAERLLPPPSRRPSRVGFGGEELPSRLD